MYEQAVVVVNYGWQLDLLYVGLSYLLNALLFYANSNLLLPRLFSRRHYGRYASTVVLLLVIYAFLRNGLYQLLIPTPIPGSYWQYWFLSSYRGSFFLFVSTGYWFALNALELKSQKLEQEHQLRTTERSLMEANLAFLKSQINPHFLFNSLNFLYAQVYPHSQQAAQGILLLSDTMRYALHEDNKGKVMLTQEVKHLHNYIALNQLRFNNQLQIDFQVEGTLQFSMILPLVLITFVENCFKHGELGDAANPLVIHLAVVHNQLTFRTRNKKREGPKEKSTGIGLDNTRKRLDIVYGDRYTLTVENGPIYYTCNLTINL